MVIVCKLLLVSLPPAACVLACISISKSRAVHCVCVYTGMKTHSHYIPVQVVARVVQGLCPVRQECRPILCLPQEQESHPPTIPFYWPQPQHCCQVQCLTSKQQQL